MGERSIREEREGKTRETRINDKGNRGIFIAMVARSAWEG
jgi:hypothetical protein